MRATILLILVVACSGQSARDETWERHAAALSGHWMVRFDFVPDGPAIGSMELTANRAVNRQYPRIGTPTNYGTYAIAFPGLGGSPSGSRVPAVVAGVIRDDSVFIFFETDRDAFAMQMRGRLSGDSVRGGWSAEIARGTIASGTFTMTRR